jgi:hypothetical protein
MELESHLGLIHHRLGVRHHLGLRILQDMGRSTCRYPRLALRLLLHHHRLPRLHRHQHHQHHQHHLRRQTLLRRQILLHHLDRRLQDYHLQVLQAVPVLQVLRVCCFGLVCCSIQEFQVGCSD